MCGIAGIVAPGASRYDDALRRMTDSLSHRGPDGEGRHYFDSCALGHRRLSIVDLESGVQPMLTDNGRVGITFNGEIYGYAGIRETLGDYRFRTASDTEVILALHRQHGTRLLPRLPGMFAFALWDDQSRELFCARDRFGEKPFYYAIGTGGEFVFASEIKAIIASGLVQPRIDKGSLAHYLKHLYVPVDRSIYGNIHALPPAHYLLWRDGALTVKRYWELPPPADSLTLDAAVERFRDLMGAAVERQLVADVEVGAFLSGGLDSSTIVALAARHTARLKTIAFGFGGGTNELGYAREIARRYGTEHVEIVDSGLNIAELLTEMSLHYDEPFADSSNIPTFLICRHAAATLKVALSGDGGDELLAGYDYWYRPLLWAEERGGAAVWRARLAALAAEAMTRLGTRVPRQLGQLAAGHALRGLPTAAERHRQQNVYFTDLELAGFGLAATPAEPPPLYGGVDDALRMDLADYMPGDILVKTDRASMANGLELRAPFLDAELASFLIGLPLALKLDAERDKKVLRRAFEDLWTASIRTRGKQGFGAPVSVWLRQPGMRELVRHHLGPGGRLSTLFDPRLIEAVARRNDYRTWIMLVLGIWMERHGHEGF